MACRRPVQTLKAKDHGDGSYSAEFPLEELGEHRAILRTSAARLKDSEYSLLVQEAVPEHTRLAGPVQDAFQRSLQEKVFRVGDQIPLEIAARDSDARPSTSRDEPLQVRISGPREEGEGISVPLQAAQDGGGIYRGKFQAREVGQHSLTAELRGEAISGSPVQFRVLPAVADPDATQIRGAGVWGGAPAEEARLQPEQDTVFAVHLLDRNGESCADPDTEVRVRLLREADGAEIPSQHLSLRQEFLDGGHSVQEAKFRIPAAVGRDDGPKLEPKQESEAFLCEVTVNGSPIPQSPIRILVELPPPPPAPPAAAEEEKTVDELPEKEIAGEAEEGAFPTPPSASTARPSSSPPDSVLPSHPTPLAGAVEEGEEEERKDLKTPTQPHVCCDCGNSCTYVAKYSRSLILMTGVYMLCRSAVRLFLRV